MKLITTLALSTLSFATIALAQDPSTTVIDVFLLGGKYPRASVISANADTTLLYIDPAVPIPETTIQPYTVTLGPTSIAASFVHTVDGTQTHITRSCSFQPTTTVHCANTWSVDGAEAQETDISQSFAPDGEQMWWPLTVTAGVEKLTSPTEVSAAEATGTSESATDSPTVSRSSESDSTSSGNANVTPTPTGTGTQPAESTGAASSNYIVNGAFVAGLAGLHLFLQN